MPTRDIMTLIDQLEHLAQWHHEESDTQEADEACGVVSFHLEAERQIREAIKAINEYEMAKR